MMQDPDDLVDNLPDGWCRISVEEEDIGGPVWQSADDYTPFVQTCPHCGKPII